MLRAAFLVLVSDRPDKNTIHLVIVIRIAGMSTEVRRAFGA
jgi:hypothetical protein